MVKVFNNSNTTFLLTADDGTQMKVPFKAFAEIEDKFKGDITYRMAMASGALSVFETTKQGDAAERNAHKRNRNKPADNKPADDKGDGVKGEETAETTADGKGDDAK